MDDLLLATPLGQLLSHVIRNASAGTIIIEGGKWCSLLAEITDAEPISAPDTKGSDIAAVIDTSRTEGFSNGVFFPCSAAYADPQDQEGRPAEDRPGAG